MDRDNQQIPGFGFDPGYEPQPLPLVPTPSSSSIFGLISKVNKGILKGPQESSETGKEVQGNPAVQQAKAIAKKLSDISPQAAKQKAFQNAKTTIENIQKGIWNPPASNRNKQSSSDTDFKIPSVTPVPKQGILSNKGQVHSTQGQEYGVTKPQTSSPQTLGTGKGLVAYDEDALKQSSNFTRQEALNEIDRYRGPARSYNKDQCYDETRKKEEPFKSDFDRYYYGNETQRSEIADKLYRTDIQDDFNSGKDYTSKQFKEPRQSEGGVSRADYKDVGETRPRNDNFSDNSKFDRYDSENYQRFGNQSYHTSGNENYQRPVSGNYQRSGYDNYKRTESDSYERKTSAGNYARDYEHINEGNTGKDNFVQKDKEINATDNRHNNSRVRDSGPYGRSWENDQQQNEEGIEDYDAYLQSNRTRNTGSGREHDDGRRSWDHPDSRRHDFHDRHSPTVLDYGHSAHTPNIQGSYRTSQHAGDFGDRHADVDHGYRHDRDNRGRGEERGRDRDRSLDNRDKQNYRRDDQDFFSDRFHDRNRDDRYRYKNDEYDDDMANMEELSEESEHIDVISPDGKVLYEDFLFGDDDEGENDKRRISRESHHDNRGDNYSRRKTDDFREGRHKDDKGNFRQIGRSNSRDRNQAHGTSQDRGRNEFREKRKGQRFGTHDRNLPITDDQKAQVVKPAVKMGVPQPVPPPTGVLPPSVPSTTVIPLATTVIPHTTTAILPATMGLPHATVMMPQASMGMPPPSMGMPPPSMGMPHAAAIPHATMAMPPPTIGMPRVTMAMPPPSIGMPRTTAILPPAITSVPSATMALPPPGMGMPRATNAVPHPSMGMPHATAGLSPTNTAIPVATAVIPPATTGILLHTAIPSATAALPPPGIICKDCNVTCMDADVFDAHLKSDAHILALQRKAQELFHMQSRSSRFDVDSSGNPLKAPVLPPATVITGVASSSTVTSAVPEGEKGCSADSGDVSQKRDERQGSPTRYRSRSDSGVQVIPPKPLGPLETKSVHSTWLVIQWRTRHDDEEALIDKYVVEYRNARETRWVKVGATIKHELEVNGLQEGTDYLFRVYTTNRQERSEYLESVLVTTKKRRDSLESERRLLSRDRERDRGRRASRERDQKNSRQGDRRPFVNRKNIGGRKHSGDRKPSGDGKTRGDRKPSGDRKASGDRDRKTSRDRISRQNKDKESKSVKKKVGKDEKQTKTGRSETCKAETGKDRSTEDNKSPMTVTEEKPEVIDVDKLDGSTPEEMECLLYREFPNFENEPMLGLDNIYEIRSYLPKTPPRYVCKLCNNKGSHKIIVKHIIGFPHKLNYFKKHSPEIFDMINMIAVKKQQVERANYEARLQEDRLGRGSVRVTLMLNPHDNNGKVVYTDPVPVKAPAPARQKEIGEAPEVYDSEFQSQFQAIYNEAVENGTLVDSTLIGLNYIKELLHPKMEKEPKYSCSMCSVLCYDTTILSHLVGKKHRFNYLKAYHEDVYDEIMNTKPFGNKHQMLIDKIREFAEKDGTGTIKTKVARNERMWRDKASKAEEVQAQAALETEAQVQQEVEGNLEIPLQHEPEQPAEDNKSSAGVQAIKFGIKKNEPQPTNVKPINVLEQEQANPKHKEAFDWNKENGLLQSRIHNETIIKSSRKSKFLTVYSEFFKRYPVIGMQWVTEFQKQDVKQEPWYMCFMCQQKLQWKSILDHVTSNLHRLNYMKKSDYRQKYNAVYHAIKKDKQSARPLIEQYSKEIAGIEGPPTEIEVMLELNVNTEAFKSVAKVQENVKAFASATPSTQSIQIIIAATSVSTSSESSSTVQLSSGQFPITTQLSSASVQSQNLAPGVQIGSVTQHYPGQATALHAQTRFQAPPMRAPPLRPPPLRPPPVSAMAPNPMFPPPAMQSGHHQRLPIAAVPPSVPFQSTANVNVSAPPGSIGTSGMLPQPPNNAYAVQGQLQMMQMPNNPGNINIRQPLMSGPMHRPPYGLGPLQRPPPLLQTPQMGQMPLRPPAMSMPAPGQGPPPQALLALSGLKPAVSNTPVMSAQSLPPSNVNLQGSTSLIGHRPPPWQRQPFSLQNQSMVGSLPEQPGPLNIIDLSVDSNHTEDNPYLSTPVRGQFVSGSETVRSNEYNDRLNNPNSNRRENIGQRQSSWVDYDGEGKDLDESQESFDVGDTNSSKKFRETERGLKRFGREPEYEDRNKRLRNDDQLQKAEQGVENQQRSYYGKPSQDYGDQRDTDQRRPGIRDRNHGRGNNRESNQRRVDDIDRGQRGGDSRDRDQKRGNTGDREQRREGNGDREQRTEGNGDRDKRRVNDRDRSRKSGITRNTNHGRLDSGDTDQRQNDYRGNRSGREQRSRGSGERDQRVGGSRDREQRSEDSSDRRRSRSPLRSARRSPAHTRQRDEPLSNKNDRYGRTSEHTQSPSRKTLGRDRNNDIYNDNRRQQSYHSDKQIQMEEYNLPLDEAKVEDLVRQYSDRVDNDYDNFMGHEGEFDDFTDTKLGSNIRDEGYGRNNEQYYIERGNQRSDFNRRNFQGGPRDVDDYRYERDTGDRSEKRTFDSYHGETDKKEYSEGSSDRYGEFSGMDYGRNQSSRGTATVNREYGSVNRRGRAGGVQRQNRGRNGDNYGHDQYWQEGGNPDTETKNVEEWPREYRQQNISRQGEVRRNRDEAQDYGRGDSDMSRTFDNRRDYARDLQTDTQRYRYNDERQYDEGGVQDDSLPDPSREEIDALLRRANTMVTPPHEEFNDYEDGMPRENMNLQGSTTTYQRGGRGRRGYRGWGPRSAARGFLS